MKNSRLLTLGLLAFVLSVVSCKKDPTPTPTPVTPTPPTSDAAVQWANQTISVILNSPLNSPTYASRSVGYMGLTMYETVVNGSTQYRSMAGQLNQLTALPQPTAGKTYDWVIAMNAGQQYMLKNLYLQAPTAAVASIDSLAAAILKTESVGLAQAVIDSSVAYGVAVATAIFNWSKTDGGYQGYLHNYTTAYTVPTTPGSWTPPSGGQSASTLPLHPYWGQNRNFVTSNGLMPVPSMIPYSTDPKSQCYAEFLEVYAKNLILTQPEKQIAAWWQDDPSATYSPPGHSYNIATIVIKKAQPDLFKAAETYAQVGMALADAFINCWRCKYTYVSIRPTEYIRANIDATFTQFWPEPPFPAFMSGHATQGEALAAVLTSLYGDNFTFTDNTNDFRAPDLIRNVTFTDRSYTSFFQMADECAYSRFLGGIHANQDNAVGQAQGLQIGQNVTLLNWLK